MALLVLLICSAGFAFGSSLGSSSFGSFLASFSTGVSVFRFCQVYRGLWKQCLNKEETELCVDEADDLEAAKDPQLLVVIIQGFL